MAGYGACDGHAFHADDHWGTKPTSGGANFDWLTKGTGHFAQGNERRLVRPSTSHHGTFAIRLRESARGNCIEDSNWKPFTGFQMKNPQS